MSTWRHSEIATPFNRLFTKTLIIFLYTANEMKPLQTPHSAFIHSFISDRLCISVHVKYQFNSICKYDFPSIQERERMCWKITNSSLTIFYSLVRCVQTHLPSLFGGSRKESNLNFLHPTIVLLICFQFFRFVSISHREFRVDTKRAHSLCATLWKSFQEAKKKASSMFIRFACYLWEK